MFVLVCFGKFAAVSYLDLNKTPASFSGKNTGHLDWLSNVT